MPTELGGGEARASSLGEGVGVEANDIDIIVHGEEGPHAWAPPRAEGCLCFIRVKLEKKFLAWISLPWVSTKRKPSFRGSRVFSTEPTHGTGGHSEWRVIRCIKHLQ